MKKTKLLITTLAMSIILGMTAFAGQWQQDGSTWKYQQDDSTYAVNGWQWIDGNGDGTAECYYFDGNGAMLANTTTPDGYTVDASGAWTELGIVRTKAVVDTAPIQGGENNTIPTGYNEQGLSNVAIDILEHTREENAAKYGESKVEEDASYFDVYYNNLNFIVEYQYANMTEKPLRIYSLKDHELQLFENAPMTGNAYTDRDVLKSQGYVTTTNGEYVNADLGKYMVDINSYSKRIEAFIKFDYR